MIKKSLSLTLIVCMVMSLFIITPVSAGAPVVFDGTTQVMFDQSFGGHRSESDLTDFAVTGTGWKYTDYFMIAETGDRTVKTKKSYDVSDCASYTFSVRLSCEKNGYYIYLAKAGGNETGAGYLLSYHNDTDKIALYKDGKPANNKDTSDALATLSTGNVYGSEIDINVTYEKATNTLTVTNSKNTNKIVYTPEDGSVPNLNGVFGIKGNYAGMLTLFSMKLTKHYDSVTVNEWKYDKKFSSKDTIAGLEAEGYTFDAGFSVNDSGIKSAHNNRRVTFGPDGKNFSGNYYFETQIQRSTNSYHLEFNKSATGCYRVWYGITKNTNYPKPWIRLEKYDASTGKTHILVDEARESITAGLDRKYKVWVKNLEDGSVDLKVEIYDGSTLDATLEYTDTATDTRDVTTIQNVTDAEGNIVYEEDGVTPKTEEVTTAVDTGAPLTSGKISVYWQYCGDNSYLKYLNAYSILEATAGTPVTVSQNVINKTFSGTDTKESIATEGFTTSLSSGVTLSFDNNYLKFSGKSNSLIYTNPDDINGSYSLTTSFKHSNNYGSVKFNYKDSKNYYLLKAHHHADYGKKLALVKFHNGTEYILDSVAITSNNQAGSGRITTVNIDVEENDDGSIKITAKWDNDKLKKEFTYLDTTTDMIDKDGDGVKETNTGAPITSGTAIRVKAGYSASYIYTFKLDKRTTEMQGATSEVPEYSAVFYGDSGVINELTNGNIYFEYPVARLGTYTVVATLHEGNEMTGLKVLSPLDLYSGKNLLFSVTDVESAKVRVYFFDAEDTLNRLTQVYELN